MRFGEDFTQWDNWLGALVAKMRGDASRQTNMPATNIFSTRLSQGLEFLGGFHGTALPPSTARQGERHNFTVIRFEVSRTQTLFVPWEGASVALMALVTGYFIAQRIAARRSSFIWAVHASPGVFLFGPGAGRQCAGRHDRVAIEFDDQTCHGPWPVVR